MADPLSITSGLISSVTFALQSSKLLYQAIESFRSNRRTIRELKEELEALDGVLKSLHETATNTDADLAALELPLLRCGKVCKDFEAVIVKCAAHSGGSGTSFRDWAKLKYMGDDIVGFRNMLAGYKSTITIALGDVNIRTATITANVLKQYKDMIKNTTSDLEEHLQEIDNKLQTLSLQGKGVSDEDAAERQRIEEERDSTQQCLGICSQVFARIDQVQPNAFENVPTSSNAYQEPATTHGRLDSAWLVTANALKECKDNLTNTTTRLQRHLEDINNQLQNSSKPPRTSNEQAAEQERIQEEMYSIKQCLAICAQASEQADQDRTNVFEDISMAEDGHQVLVATLGDLISARRVTAGARSTQWLGQMSDASLQQLSRDHGRAAIDKAMQPQAGTSTQFENRYGARVKLSSESLKGAGGPHQ